MIHRTVRRLWPTFFISFLLLPVITGCETFESITPEQATELINNPTRPDARREGVAAFATRWDFGKRPPYLARYQQLAQHDVDPAVRAMAIRALNICRDPSSTKIFIAGLQDDSQQIRLESAKALANIPDPEAVTALMYALNGTRRIMGNDGRPTSVAEAKDVRIAAADALRQYRKLDVARTLVGYLNESDFGVAWQARQSLVAMTGQDLNYNESNWLQYLIGPNKPFS